MIKCALCKKEFYIITDSHCKKKHGISLAYYKYHYSKEVEGEERRAKKRKRHERFNKGLENGDN